MRYCIVVNDFGVVYTIQIDREKTIAMAKKLNADSVDGSDYVPYELKNIENMTIKCDQIDRFQRIESEMKDLKDSIDNKKDGLFKTIIQLTDQMKMIADIQEKQGANIDKLTSIVTKITESGIESNVKAGQVQEDMKIIKDTVDALRVSGIRTEAEDKLISKLTQEREIRNRWVIGLSLVSGLSIIGLFLKIISG